MLRRGLERIAERCPGAPESSPSAAQSFTEVPGGGADGGTRRWRVRKGASEDPMLAAAGSFLLDPRFAVPAGGCLRPVALHALSHALDARLGASASPSWSRRAHDARVVGLGFSRDGNSVLGACGGARVTSRAARDGSLEYASVAPERRDFNAGGVACTSFALMSCAKDTAHNNNLPRSTFKGVISCTACGFPTRRDGSTGKEHKVECPACGFAQRKRKRGSRGVRPAKGTKKAATSNQAAYRL